MDHWERCAPWLKKALDAAGNTHSLETVRVMCEQGHAHFWPFPRFAVVTEFIEYPEFRALNLWLIAGEDLHGMLPFLPQFERWARDNHCKRIQGEGREEWALLAKRLGFRPAAVSLVKEFRE